MKSYWVYILTNQNNKVLYKGVSSEFEQRIYQHKNKLITGFTEKNNVNKLIYYEETTDPVSAISREKQLKGWTRRKKKSLSIK